ncbi:DUF4445 domain-containing protein [Candidatus Aerophobetes bacterium]|nr:DUF4445 domain-containing protein [Candidatus Aerophobetes bacterium]
MAENKKKNLQVSFLPSGKKVTFQKAISLREAIIKAKIDFSFPCGGNGLCGKCKVKVKGNTNPPSLKEKETIPEWLEKGYRLACQTILYGNAEVEIPVSSLISTLRILTEGSEEKFKVDPFVQKIYLSLPPPTLKDQISDVARIKRELRKKGFDQLKIDLRLIKKVPFILRESQFKTTVVLNNKEIINLEEGDTRGKNFGLAFDIGTTTVVGSLIDLDTGNRIATKAILNPQTIYGDDVISRVSYLQNNSKGLLNLQRKIVGGINEIVDYLVNSTGVKRKNIYEITLVGNTVMQHLLSGVNPLNLALYPYVPVTQDPINLKSYRLGIKINPLANIYVFPNIAAFVGGDTVGVILATEMHKINNKTKLAIDIGTNGEIVLSHEGKLVAASTAAGPAFEGSRISHGMWAQDGAIEKVRLKDGEVIIDVIGGGRPTGICGSGLIDSISEFYKEGIIDRSGRIKPVKEQSRLWRNRIVEDEEGGRFILWEDGEKSSIFISQKDIREFQLAKAAIYTGIKILLDKLEVKRENVEEVLIAGAFGNYINLESAYNVGLLPKFPNSKVKNVGNAAILGAIKALISRKSRQEAEEIPHLVHYVELAATTNFQDVLTDSIFLGEKESNNS